MTFLNHLGSKWFEFVHGNNLVYNTCWEDPRLDHQVLDLTPDDTVLVITSAGCNALDYLIKGCRVHGVDMNSRQNAVLELKKAGIRRLDHPTFFKMWGKGRISGARDLYQAELRDDLSQASREFWDKKIDWFDGAPTDSFYFHGSSGVFAKGVNLYIDHVARCRESVTKMLDAPSLEEQARVYKEEFSPKFWTKVLRKATGWKSTMAVIGVPEPQVAQINRTYGGLSEFIEDRVNRVFSQLPLKDNYFYRVYLTGSYTPECCPEYLKPENFETLRDNLDRLQTHTNTVQGFLEGTDERVSRFVLLDHMDWMSTHRIALLASEWQAIVNNARDDSRIIWRSGGFETGFVDRVEVERGGKTVKVGDILDYQTEETTRLHELDRVHTYGSFYAAHLVS